MRKHDEEMMRRAIATFAHHEIRKADEQSGRWVLQKRYNDLPDTWDGHAWMEIISLEGGMLYVGGDYPFVIFAYYSDKLGNHRAKVRWMGGEGEHSDFSYYVHQKARMGTGDKLIDVYDGEDAKNTVRGWLDDLDMSEDRDFALGNKIRLILADGWLDWNDQHSIEQRLLEDLGYDFLTDRCCRFGMIIDTRLYFAYAALRRLCEIWDQKQNVKGERT